MNAVTTAEYVVIVEDFHSEIQEQINNHAKQGYRLVSLETNPENKWESPSFTAVMVRETVSTELLNRIADLETRLQALDANYENTRQQVISHESVRLGTRSRLDSLEARCNDIEAKIDWSK